MRASPVPRAIAVPRATPAPRVMRGLPDLPGQRAQPGQPVLPDHVATPDRRVQPGRPAHHRAKSRACNSRYVIYVGLTMPRTTRLTPSSWHWKRRPRRVGNSSVRPDRRVQPGLLETPGLPDLRGLAEARALPVLPVPRASRVCPGPLGEPSGVVPVELVLPDRQDLRVLPVPPGQPVPSVLPVPQSLLKSSRVLWERYLPGCQVSLPTRPITSGM